MGFDRRATDGHVLVERGSAAIEGIAAVAVVFILFTFLAQAATALIAHRAAGSAVAASASRVALAPSTVTDEVPRLEHAMAAIVPGSRGADVAIEVGPVVVTATAAFTFTPPGPVFRSFEMEVSADVPLVVEP